MKNGEKNFLFKNLMIIKCFFFCIFLCCTNSYAQKQEYTLNFKNLTSVNFILLTKTCNGGVIQNPPLNIPPAPAIVSFSVQKDGGVGCMLLYDDQLGSKLGIWIRDHQVSCSNEGGFVSYRCVFWMGQLTIDR